MSRRKSATMSQPQTLPLIFDDGAIAALDADALLALFARIGVAVRSVLLDGRPIVMSDFQTVTAYLQSQMMREPVEQFRVLFLNKQNQLIADEVIGTGTVDHVGVYPREVCRRAIELSATALILAHNHPSGSLVPSHGDVEMTKRLVEALAIFGITVHDHFIISREGTASLRALKLM